MGLTGACARSRPTCGTGRPQAWASSSAAALAHMRPWQRPMPRRLSALSRLKALTRIGMGRGQGRMCAPAAARLLSEAAGCALKDVGRLRSQPPVKPVPVAVLGAALAAPTAVPQEERDD